MSCCTQKIFPLCDIPVCAGEPIVIKTPELQLAAQFPNFYAEVYFKHSVIVIDPVPEEKVEPQPLTFVLNNPNEKYCYKMVIWQKDLTVLGNRKVVEFTVDGQVYNAISFCTIYKKANC